MATKKSTYEVKKPEETVETSASLFEAESEPIEKPEPAPVKTVRKYDPEDMIPCRSVTNGSLYITGNRSKFGYVWADYGDVVEMEYRDLIFLVRSINNKEIYGPRIIVMDDEFIEQNKELKTFYASHFKVKELRDILDLSPALMRKEIENLPAPAKDSLKGIIATMIDTGALDSVQKIKILDEILGTQLILTLAQ